MLAQQFAILSHRQLLYDDLDFHWQVGASSACRYKFVRLTLHGRLKRQVSRSMRRSFIVSKNSLKGACLNTCDDQSIEEVTRAVRL